MSCVAASVGVGEVGNGIWRGRVAGGTHNSSDTTARHKSHNPVGAHKRKAGKPRDAIQRGAAHARRARRLLDVHKSGPRCAGAESDPVPVLAARLELGGRAWDQAWREIMVGGSRGSEEGGRARPLRRLRRGPLRRGAFRGLVIISRVGRLAPRRGEVARRRVAGCGEVRMAPSPRTHALTLKR